MPFGKPIEQVEVAPGDVREFHELTMGGFNQLQAFVSKQRRPEVQVFDLAGPLQEVADKVAEQFAHVPGLDQDGRLKVLAEFRQASLRLAEAQMREARWEAGQWPPDMGTPEAARCLMTSDGGKAYFLWVMLRQQRPETTRAQADALLDGMDPEAFYRIVGIAWPSNVADQPEGPAPDPKGPAGPPASPPAA